MLHHVFTVFLFTPTKVSVYEAVKSREKHSIIFLLFVLLNRLYFKSIFSIFSERCWSSAYFFTEGIVTLPLRSSLFQPTLPPRRVEIIDLITI